MSKGVQSSVTGVSCGATVPVPVRAEEGERVSTRVIDDVRLSHLADLLAVPTPPDPPATVQPLAARPQPSRGPLSLGQVTGIPAQDPLQLLLGEPAPELAL